MTLVFRFYHLSDNRQLDSAVENVCGRIAIVNYFMIRASTFKDLERICLLSIERELQAGQLRMRCVSLRQLSLGLIQHVLDEILQLLLGAVQRRSEFLKLGQFRAVFSQVVHFARHSSQILVFGWKWQRKRGSETLDVDIDGRLAICLDRYLS